MDRPPRFAGQLLELSSGEPISKNLALICQPVGSLGLPSFKQGQKIVGGNCMEIRHELRGTFGVVLMTSIRAMPGRECDV